MEKLERAQWGKYEGWREPAVGDRVRFSSIIDGKLIEDVVSATFDNGGMSVGRPETPNGYTSFTRDGVRDCILVFKGDAP